MNYRFTKNVNTIIKPDYENRSPFKVEVFRFGDLGFIFMTSYL